MDNRYNKGRNPYTIPAMLRDLPGRVVQPQPVSYAITPLPYDDLHSSLLSGGAHTFFEARSSVPLVQPKPRLSQPSSLPVPLRTISIS
jgi:hypothetical protein